MGCLNSHPSVLERYAGEVLAYRADVSNEVTSIDITRKKILWKVCEDEAPVIHVTFLNNYRVQHLPPSPWIVQPQKLFKLSPTKMAISMEYHPIDLFNLVSTRFDLQRVWAGMRDVVRGMAYLHSKGLAHRDIKPENIVVGNTYFHLIDFDFTSPLTDYVHCGTPLYIVPAAISDQWDCSNRTRSIRYDIYAFGKTIIHILYQAALGGLLERQFITSVYKKQGLLEGVQNPFDGATAIWFDVALRCCQKEPSLGTIPATDKTVNTFEVVYADNIAT